MQLVNDWRKVLRHAWSVRWMIVAVVFTFAEVALPLMDGYLPIPQGVFAALSAFAACGALASRFIMQKEFHDE